MNQPDKRKENFKDMLITPYLKVYDFQYEPGKSYVIASRRDKDSLPALKNSRDFRKDLPDAVTCFVIINLKGEEKLLLAYEYRYPLGHYLLSPPAGLIDPDDLIDKDPLIKTAVREIKEETGISVGEEDEVFVVNPNVFSSPGMTDEGNALVCAKITLSDLSALNQEGAEGSELFDGFELLSRDQALAILKEGVDPHGNPYPVYTWAALMYFVNRLI